MSDLRPVTRARRWWRAAGTDEMMRSLRQRQSRRTPEMPFCGNKLSLLKLLVLFLLACSIFGNQSTARTQSDSPSPKEIPSQSATRLSGRWWESASAIRNVTLKDDFSYPQLSLTVEKAEQQLRSLKEDGFAGIQVFAPADGGKSYHGLDTRDHYRIDPKYGSVEDFKRIVQATHRLDMPVITFINLGYSGLDAPSFLKACDDVREAARAKR